MAGHLDISEQCQKEESGTRSETDILEKKFYESERQSSFCKLKRYTRYDLLSLRNGQVSIHYPHCALRPDLQALSIWTCRLRCELQYLGLWKAPNIGNQYGNCSCNGSCQSYACSDSQSYPSSNLVNIGAQQQPQTSSSPTLGSKRAVRSRERSLNYQRCINTEIIRSTSPSEGSIHHLNHQAKTALIDHRSISSSHLMPAFAKRRMSNVNSLHNTSEICSTFNNNGHNLEHDISDGENSNQFETSLKTRKDSIKVNSNQSDYQIYKSSLTNSRVDKKDQFGESQAGWINLVKKIHSDYSPSNNKANAGGFNKKIIYERRIGSGRLVPRDGNWDIRTGNSKPIEKENSITASNTGEKDNLTEIEKSNHRNSSSRYSDTRAQERRLYDRRISNTDDFNAILNKRYTPSLGEERNNFDSSTNHYQQTQHFTGQRSMSFRRREYGEYRDHRDFRELKDSRENREHREQRDHRDHKDEPEWFSEGPTSQHDTIELRGFEENDDTQQQNTIKYSKINRKSSDSSLSHNSSNINLSTKENLDISNQEATNNNINTLKNDNDTSINVKIMPNNGIANNIENDIKIVEKPEETENIENGSNVSELFFDNILNIEALENTLIGGNDQTVPNNDCGTSRFSRWFISNSNKNTIKSDDDNNPSSKNETKLNKDFNESEFNSFMKFLKCNNFPTPDLPKSLPSNVSALSVEELEARMRKIDPIEIEKIKNDHLSLPKSDCPPDSEESTSRTTDINTQDVEAFRKLLDQLGKPRVDISMNIILPTSGHSLPLAPSVGILPTGIIPNSLSQSNMAKQEYMMKVMHHQQQLLHHQQHASKVVPPLQHHRMTQMSSHEQQPGVAIENLALMSLPPHPHIMPMVIGHPQKRIDVQHLVQSVLREELSRSFLEKELKNPNIPIYTKDIISTVLKETSRRNTSLIPGRHNTLSAPDSTEAVATDNTAPNNLMQSLARGEVSLNLLEHELNKLNNMSIVNDLTTGVFKEIPRCATPSAAQLNIVPIPTSGVNVPLSQVPGQQNSILPNESICAIPHEQQGISMIRTHHEDPLLHIPTQRELQMHTQAIMQNALFKKKLEVEHHEAIRRRQEIHKQHELESSNQQNQSQNITSNMSQQVHQPLRHMNSPTPLAFTPTSVLRKMTAEKDTNSIQTTITSPQQLQQPHLKIPHQQIHTQQLSYQHVNQPRMILGGGNFQYMHQQHQIATASNGSPQISPQQKAQIRNQPPGALKWPLATHSPIESNHLPLNNMSKPMGRPILKGPIPSVTQNPHSQSHNQSNVNQNTQSIQTISQIQKYSSIQQQPRQIIGQQFSTHVTHQIPTSQQNNVQHQQLFQQQRSVVMQRQQIQTDIGNHASIPPPAHHPDSNGNNTVTNLNYQRDGGLSPTSNQLAQWFSPELLAQASAGKLPLLNMNQALSLEEFERSIQHSSTAVHN